MEFSKTPTLTNSSHQLKSFYRDIELTKIRREIDIAKSKTDNTNLSFDLSD
jgi:hypothetical protein